MRTHKLDYAGARQKWKPDKVRVLFIAESPPSSGGFFYFDQTTGRDHLFRETMKALALWKEDEPMHKGLDKRGMLDRFKSRGFYLLDVCQAPVDKLPRRQRMDTVSRQAGRLARDAKDLDPEQVVMVKASIFSPVIHALGLVGLAGKVLNDRPLPFPSHGNQKRYRDSLNGLLRT